MKKQQDGSDEQLNEEINDKLNDLWTGMNDKRKQLVRNMTPSYSRRTDQSELNQSSTLLNPDNNLFKIREKLAAQVLAGKQKEQEIENLKTTITQLTNDKKMLIYQLQQMHGNNQNLNSSLLNQSSINYSKVEQIKNTANFSTGKKEKEIRRNKNKHFATIQEEGDDPNTFDINKHPFQEKLEDLSKARLVELLRSTAEYRQFVFYYDSHQLSFLKKLQEKHKRNCDHTISLRQKNLWAPTQIWQQFIKLNEKYEWYLQTNQMQEILSFIKGYYERNYEEKIKKNKEQYGNKLKKQKRQAQNNLPYDLVQVCRAKERQLTKMAKRTKTNSFV